MTCRRAALVLAAAVLVAGSACGDDEPAGTGTEVEGRAPERPRTTGDGTTSTSTEDASTTTTAPLAEARVALTPVAELDSPTKLLARPRSTTLYVAEQAGRIATLRPEGDALAEGPTALDLTPVTRSGGERGLLGLAFSPDGDTLYVHHSGLGGETRIAAFAMDGDVADPASRVDLLEVDQPFANHNGGDILVDDEGLLWIGLGDGGSAGDPQDRAQDPDDLLGKILRIDPTARTGALPYAIPPDNPYADGGGRPEIAVTGLRNPWRLRFDPATGGLWIADVGQSELEEIDHLPADAILGANLGWSRFEGSATYDESRQVRGEDPVLPVFEMAHGDGWCSVTGGPVYRGAALPDLAGAYLFGDYCKPGLAALRLADGEVVETTVLDDTVTNVVSIDTDDDGEVYVVSQKGPVYRLTPAS